MLDKFRRSTTTDIWYISLLLTQILLIWLLPYFPTQDGPSHLYNAAILHDLLNGGKEWGEYFTYELKATPNLGFNLIVSPLLVLVKPLIAEKIFLTIYILLMGFSVRYFIRTFAPGKPLTVQLLAIPVIFNFTLMMGFYSYSIAVPVFLIALAMVWRQRNSGALIQFTLCNIAGVTIFYLHLIPFIFFLIALAVIAVTLKRLSSPNSFIGDPDLKELKDWIPDNYLGNDRADRASGELEGIRESSKSAPEGSWCWGTFLRRIAMMLPLVILLASYLGGNKKSGTPADFSYLLSADRFMTLFSDLFTFSTVSLSPLQIIPAALAMFVTLLLMRSLVKDSRTDRVTFDAGQKTLVILAACLTVIYFAAPFRFGEGSFFNDRFPWVILLIILPLLACVNDKAASAASVGMIGVAVLSVALNIFVFRQQSDEVAAFLSGLESGCKKGDGVLLYRTVRPPWPKVDVLLHAASYYGMFNGCVDLGNYEPTMPYFPIRFRQDVSTLPGELAFAYGKGEIDFAKYPVIKRVIGWDLKADEVRKMGGVFERVFVNDRLMILSRR